MEYQSSSSAALEQGLLASYSEEESVGQGSRLLGKDAPAQGGSWRRRSGAAGEESEEVCGWGWKGDLGVSEGW